MPPRWEGWDDAAVAPEKLGPYLRDLRALLDDYDYQAAFYGHFGHGCIHMQVSFDLQSDAGIRKYGAFVDDAADLVVRYGGSLSGEHGDGQSRGALLPKMFGPELMAALRRVQVDLGSRQQAEPRQARRCARRRPRTCASAPTTRRAKPATHFQFPDDGGSLATATLRCIGVGECRKHDAGTMCPSYMATLEEEHSTRGRAHMLFEMLQGDVLARRLERRAGEAVARPLPVVQGVQVRVPDQRRHRDLPRRVPVALLREPSPSAARLRVRHGGPLAVAGVDRAGARQRR